MEDTGTATSNKRFRDEDEEESPEAKRIRADLLLDILDDDDSEAAGGRGAAVQDLASVMRSLEEEIKLPASSGADLDGLRQPDLGYLLEASDDELGLPPPLPCSSDEAEEELLGGCEAEAVGFGQIWGLDDEIQIGCYDGLDFGFRPEEREVVGGGEDGLVFDGGLFDYADALCGPADFSDSAWRSEYLPAV